jgi:hypothetical protein
MWRDLVDDNPENASAGSSDDLVKHTVYLAALAWLLERAPWRRGMRLRECHAGRGVYRLPEGDPRRALSADLLRTDLLLAGAQRDALDALDAGKGWYAGSALLVARLLARAGIHRYEGYEWFPATRRVLASVLREGAALDANVPLAGEDARFDGESHLAMRMASFGLEDVVLLDPFGLWLREKHAFRRARYRRILEAFDALAGRAPPLVAYFTFGRSRGASSEGPSALAPQIATRRRVVVTWRWELSSCMWLIVPAPLAEPLARHLDDHLRRLFAALAPGEALLSVKLLG